MIMKRELVFPTPQDVVIVIEKQKSLNIAAKAFYLWYLQGSNQGHTDFQSVALPSELRYQLNGRQI